MTAPVRDWQVVLAKFFGALVFLRRSLDSDASLLLDLSSGHPSAGGEFDRRLSRRLSDAALARDVLSLGRLLRLGPDQEPDRRRDHFLLRRSRFISSLGLVSFILLDISSETRQLLGYFSAIEQMGTLSRGEIDTRPMVLYLSMTIVMLALTHQAFQSRKWRL